MPFSLSHIIFQSGAVFVVGFFLSFYLIHVIARNSALANFEAISSNLLRYKDCFNFTHCVPENSRNDEHEMRSSLLHIHISTKQKYVAS